MDSVHKFNGEVHQDKFVVKMLNGKKGGFFVEIGSFDPIYTNNTYVLEKFFDWKGIMIEHDKKWLPKYKLHRPNSIHVIRDATQIDYVELFNKYDVPINIDYLQVDLEVNDGSTLTTIQKLDGEIFDKYTFTTVTFEHDIYCQRRTKTPSLAGVKIHHIGFTADCSRVCTEEGPSPG